MISLESNTNDLEETVMFFNKKAKVIYVNKTGEELSGKSSIDIPVAGTGLSISRKIIKDLMGFIIVKIRKNQGGYFYLYPSSARHG